MKTYSDIKEMIEAIGEMTNQRVIDFWQENKWGVFLLKNGWKVRIKMPV